MKSVELPVGDFKARFSEALAIVARGGSVCVTYGRSRKPVAMLVPPFRAGGKRKLGLLAGKAKIRVSKDWSLSEAEFLGE